MTPEERAAKIITDKNYLDTDWVWGRDGNEYPVKSVDEIALAADIAAAIREAVEQERERAAQVADAQTATEPESEWARCARIIATRIRALD